MTSPSVRPATTGAAPLTDRFTFKSGLSAPILAPAGNGKRGFGGDVAALALAAAYGEVEPSKSVHHLHIEFVRPTQVGAPVRASVSHRSDGRSVSRRTLEIGHPDHASAALAVATFWKGDHDGEDYQPQIHDLPPVEGSVPIHNGPVETRLVPDDRPAHQQVWMRPQILPLAEERRLHECALLFMSDLTVLWPTLTVHGRDISERHQALATVSHTVWFHRPVRIDDWILYRQEAVSTSLGLGQVRGQMFTRDGVLLATAMQVGLLKKPDSSA